MNFVMNELFDRFIIYSERNFILFKKVKFCLLFCFHYNYYYYPTFSNFLPSKYFSLLLLYLVNYIDNFLSHKIFPRAQTYLPFA